MTFQYRVSDINRDYELFCTANVLTFNGKSLIYALEEKGIEQDRKSSYRFYKGIKPKSDQSSAVENNNEVIEIHPH